MMGWLATWWPPVVVGAIIAVGLGIARIIDVHNARQLQKDQGEVNLLREVLDEIWQTSDGDPALVGDEGFGAYRDDFVTLCHRHGVACDDLSDALDALTRVDAAVERWARLLRPDPHSSLTAT